MPLFSQKQSIKKQPEKTLPTFQPSAATTVAGMKSPFVSASVLASEPVAYTGSQARIGLIHPKTRLRELPLRISMMLSAGLHGIAPLAVIVAVLLIALLLNINLWELFNRPKVAQPADMVFTLVHDTGAERPETARFKGAFNQQAGGEHDPDHEIVPVETPARPAAAARPEQQPIQPQKSQTPPPPRTRTLPKPEAVADIPKPDLKPTIPVPSRPAALPEGPVAKAAESSTASPSPQMLAAASPASAGSAATGTGQLRSGNPEAGSAKNPGVNVQQDIDFGPFMADLERRIKRNWQPPRAGDSKKVKVRFYLRRDGRLVNMELLQSSGDGESDEAAMTAIRMAAPFRPFPPAVREDILPIEFTFDYNVFDPSGRRKAGV